MTVLSCLTGSALRTSSALTGAALLRIPQAVFPNIMSAEVLEGLRAMTADVFEAVDVPEKMRYQGSSINVLTPQAWEAAGAQEGVLHDPLVAQLNKSPRQLAVAEAIGLENLRGGGALLILSKPAHGPPLYWHQASSSSPALFFAQLSLHSSLCTSFCGADRASWSAGRRTSPTGTARPVPRPGPPPSSSPTT